ncbi:MAG: hypothetical protein CSA22_03300 [Deltaproteobacteria bacterium]|nr:MAG: hypothetical protein CSA22_03300 [Deltaproteobacteria bacterium]
MIKAKRKPLEEIGNAIAPYDQILILGCGGCVSVCLAGGQRETYDLMDDLTQHLNGSKHLAVYTVERQCNVKYMNGLDEKTDNIDCILSMACGAGVQFLADRYPTLPVLPAVNTMAIGVDLSIGLYQERCRACGFCVLGYTAGVCPVTRCAKGLFNGPCGGTNKGMCEISQEIPCAWQEIYERLKAQNRLDAILDLQPPMMWENQTLRTVVQDKYAG